MYFVCGISGCWFFPWSLVFTVTVKFTVKFARILDDGLEFKTEPKNIHCGELEFRPVCNEGRKYGRFVERTIGKWMIAQLVDCRSIAT